MDSELPWQRWQMVDERAVADLTARSLKSIQRDRSLGRGIPFKKLNGSTVRYRAGDILDWLESQPEGGSTAARKTKRPRNKQTA